MPRDHAGSKAIWTMLYGQPIASHGSSPAREETSRLFAASVDLALLLNIGEDEGLYNAGAGVGQLLHVYHTYQVS